MKAILALLALVAVASAHVLTVPATGLTTVGAVGTVYPQVGYNKVVPTVYNPVYKYPQYQYGYNPVQQRVVYPGTYNYGAYGTYGSVPYYGNAAYYTTPYVY